MKWWQLAACCRQMQMPQSAAFYCARINNKYTYSYMFNWKAVSCRRLKTKENTEYEKIMQKLRKACGKKRAKRAKHNNYKPLLAGTEWVSGAESREQSRAKQARCGGVAGWALELKSSSRRHKERKMFK